MKSHIQSKFKVGDKVWLEVWNLKQNVIDRKFALKREGPFSITKTLSLILQTETPKHMEDPSSVHCLSFYPLSQKQHPWP